MSWAFSISSRHAKHPAALETTLYLDPCYPCPGERGSPCVGYPHRSASIDTIPLAAILCHITSSESRGDKHCRLIRSTARPLPRSKSPAIVLGASDRSDQSHGR